MTVSSFCDKNRNKIFDNFRYKYLSYILINLKYKVNIKRKNARKYKNIKSKNARKKRKNALM